MDHRTYPCKNAVLVQYFNLTLQGHVWSLSPALFTCFPLVWSWAAASSLATLAAQSGGWPGWRWSCFCKTLPLRESQACFPLLTSSTCKSHLLQTVSPTVPGSVLRIGCLISSSYKHQQITSYRHFTEEETEAPEA